MDELDRFVDMRGEEYRFYGSPTWVSTLLTYLFISIFSIAPSVFILYLFAKNMLYRNNFHLVIMHWTTVNLASIIAIIICTIMRSRMYNMGNATLFTDTNIRTISVVFGIFFIYNTFVRSKNCPHILYGIWIVFGVTLIVGNICATNESRFLYYVSLMYIFVIIHLLAVLLLITASFCYCVVGSNEETLKVRLHLLAVYLVSSICHWSYTLLTPTTEFSVGFFLLSMLFYSNSFFNLVLLIKYEKHTKEHFWRFAEKYYQCLKRKSSTDKLDDHKEI